MNVSECIHLSALYGWRKFQMSGKLRIFEVEPALKKRLFVHQQWQSEGKTQL